VLCACACASATNSTLRGGRQLTNSPVKVPCQNITSPCGEHGECRVSEQTCNCDNGYFTKNANKPCESKGKSQTTYALLWVFFGWTGGPAFALGWTLLGVAILATCCCGVCCYAQKDNEGLSEKKQVSSCVIGLLLLIAFCVLCIYGFVMVVTNCKDTNTGIPCNSW